MRAPFVKVEATKFTEVGYVGRDVESIIRDLVEASIRMVKQERYDMVTERAKANAEQRLVDIILGDGKKKQDANPLAMLFTNTPQLQAAKEETPEEKQQKLSKREQVEYALRGGALENKIVEIQVEDNSGIGIGDRRSLRRYEHGRYVLWYPSQKDQNAQSSRFRGEKDTY